MGIASFFGFGSKAPREVFIPVAPPVTVDLSGLRGQSVERLWREQPNLRTVVSFLARNVAQLGVHTFETAEDGNHQRVRESALAAVIKEPNPQNTTYELMYDLVSTLALYDIAYWVVTPDERAKSGWVIRPVPPSWVTGSEPDGLFGIKSYDITPPGGAKVLTVPASEMLVFHGWSPEDVHRGESPISALKGTLREQIAAQQYREQRWTKGARVDAFMTRPASAPAWSPEARRKFQRAYQAAYSGAQGGGTPLLEDGMELKRLGFSSKEDEYIEAAKLSLTTVAAVYHVNPVMVGVLDNANYSNVKEFSRMLYSDTLGPTLRMIQDRINTFMAPRIAPGEFVEFNVKEKMRGSFEEEAASLNTATGTAWMTPDEARATQNLPALGGDAARLVSNLNQTVMDSGTADPAPAADTEEV